MAFKSFFAVLLLLAASVVASPQYGTSSYKPSKPGKGGSCPSKEFYYKDKDCCLPHGGPPAKPPSPPPGKSCPPSSYYWSKDFSCCVPYHPPPAHAPPPQCHNGYEWNHATQCCEPHGTPTHSHTTHKPSQTPGHHGGHGGYGGDDGHDDNDDDHGSHGYTKRTVAPLCPRSFEACPITGLTTGTEYECLDTKAELRSCGGCASTGKGQDCTAIKGAWNVGCEAGYCAVYTCALGFKVSSDGKSCTPV